MKNKKESCELCHMPASTYCESDRARLCWECDTKVHKANFLVTKHSRILLCHICQNSTPWSASGSTLPPSFSFCVSCSSNSSHHLDDDDDDGDYEEEEEVDSSHDDDEEEDDDGDIQVVPLTSNSSSVPSSAEDNNDYDDDGDYYVYHDDDDDGELNVSMLPSSSKRKREFYMDS